MKFEWEKIHKNSSCLGYSYTYRAKIISGWLVSSFTAIKDERNICESMVFVPDPDHKWEID